MSVLPQELLRKISADSHELSEQSHSAEVPEDSFRELLQVQPTSEKPLRKDIFNLFMEDEEECDSKDGGMAMAAFAPPPALLSPPFEQEEDEDHAFEIPCAASLSALDARMLSSAAAPHLAGLPPDIEAAFEKMASCMIVMSSSHEVATTIVLDNPRFASSSLFGTKITIREFSTAPKAFNVEIVSNPLAVATIDASKNDLLSAFQNGNFNFTVHRFDTHIQQNDDRPVLHRKEDSDREQKDQRGGREQ